MRKIIFIFGVSVFCGMYVFAQTNFHTNVTNLWYQGYKTNVLAIANERLSQNTNDIAGLILKAEFQLDSSEIYNRHLMPSLITYLYGETRKNIHAYYAQDGRCQCAFFRFMFIAAAFRVFITN